MEVLAVVQDMTAALEQQEQGIPLALHRHKAIMEELRHLQQITVVVAVVVLALLGLMVLVITEAQAAMEQHLQLQAPASLMQVVVAVQKE